MCSTAISIPGTSGPPGANERPPPPPLIGRINYAYWFDRSDLQLEAEAYPFIGRALYGYLDVGFSPTWESFPEWHLGAEAFVNVPRAWELSGGARQLTFEAKDVTMLTGSLGKYYSAHWTSVRPYVAFEGGDVSWTACWSRVGIWRTLQTISLY